MNCQARHYHGQNPTNVSRRWFFRDCAVGLGSLALAQLLGPAARAEAGGDLLAPKAPPQPAKAKRVVYLFMAGAPSHLELFDYKPQLAKFDGTLPPPELIQGYRAAFISPNSKLLGPRFKFAKYGQCGTELSELLPRLAEVVDDVAVVKSMATDAFNHAPAQIMMNTGSTLFGRPSFGAWTLYGLGSESRDLPAFVVFSSGKKGPSGGNSNWGSGFLPTVYNGTIFRTGGDPVLYLSNPQGVDAAVQRDTLDAVESAQPPSARRGRRPGDCDAHQLVRDGLPDAGQRPGFDGPVEGTAVGAGHVRGGAGQGVVRQQLPSGKAAIGARRPFRAAVPRSMGPARQPQGRPDEELSRLRSAVGGAGEGPETAGNAGRHAGDLGRRVRPDADGGGRRQRRPRPPSQRLHLLAGRRRRQAGPDAGRSRTSSASMRWRTASTFTTCTRRCCTCWGSTTRS